MQVLCKELIMFLHGFDLSLSSSSTVGTGFLSALYKSSNDSSKIRSQADTMQTWYPAPLGIR